MLVLEHEPYGVLVYLWRLPPRLSWPHIQALEPQHLQGDSCSLTISPTGCGRRVGRGLLMESEGKTPTLK